MTIEEKIEELENKIVLNQENIFRLDRYNQKLRISLKRLAQIRMRQNGNNLKMILLLQEQSIALKELLEKNQKKSLLHRFLDWLIPDSLDESRKG